MAVFRGALLFFFILLVAAEIGTIDAKMGVAKQTMISQKMKEEEKEKAEKSKEKEQSQCLSQSLLFNGLCLNSDKCAEVCMKERFPGGECKLTNAVGKCFCKKTC